MRISTSLLALCCQPGPWTGYNVQLIGYNASNAALNMLTVQLAYELRDPKIKVSSANPGYTKTYLNDN